MFCFVKVHLKDTFEGLKCGLIQGIQNDRTSYWTCT